MAALAVILYTLVAHRALPGKFPGALAAVLLGVAIYLVGDWLRDSRGWALVPPLQRTGGGTAVRWSDLFSFYREPGSWWREVFEKALEKLPVVLPFALATIVGGIDCTESAAAAGDEYDTRSILLTEGIASFVAGLLGGVIQTTPYIGHPAYKKMGGRAAYTLATALFIGAAGCFGWFTLLFDFLPKAAMFPILVFVGLEITAQSFHATPPRHYPALALAMLPALAALIVICLGNTVGVLVLTGDRPLQVLQTLRCLANGFLISGLLWAAALAVLLDGRLRHSAAYFGVAGVCAFFGIIHSPLAAERIGLPHQVLAQAEADYAATIQGIPADKAGEAKAAFARALEVQTPYHWAGAYGLMALLLLGLAWVRTDAGEEGCVLDKVPPTEGTFPRPET
jgi:AGZA family xanthine/uracil permease-like MFS transporter